MDIHDKDNSPDQWKCPHCGHGSAIIIEDAVLKDDWREILCGCMQCDELFIRQYKFEKTIKLVRDK